MTDKERDAGLSTTDDETDASDDTDQRSPDGDANDVDDASSSSDGPVYGRVTPRDEIVTHGSDDDASADVAAETGDSGGDSDFGTDAAPDDADDSATNSDADSDGEPHLLTGDEHTSHAPEGTYDDSGDESADNIDSNAAADGASLALTGEDKVGGMTPSSVSAEDADFDGEDIDGLAGEAPESDQEMPLTAHVKEMIRRLAVILGVAGTITLVLFPGADILNALVDTQVAFGVYIPSVTDVINFLWNSHVPNTETIVDRRLRLYGPLEPILVRLKATGLAGTVVGLSVSIYEAYLFIHPGLYPKERKYYLAAVSTDLVLALVGVLFAHFVVLPAIFAYFISYTERTAVVAFGLKETFNLILILMDYMAVVFQTPPFAGPAIMMNLVIRQWLKNHRLLFWGAFLGLALLISPGPTGMAPIIIGAAVITLFEGALAILRWAGN